MHLGLNLLFLIPGETGGRETYARELISALFEREPDLRATAFVNREAARDLRRELGPNMDIEVVPLSARSPVQWGVGELLLLPRSAANAKVELVHSLANFGPAWGPFRRVLTIHDVQHRSIPQAVPWSRRIGTAVLMELGSRRADRIITVSSFSAAEIAEKLPVDPDRIDVIPNGVPRPLHSRRPRRELLDRFDLDDRPTVLCVSTALPHKNLAVLLDAIALADPRDRPQLVLCGAGTDREPLAQYACSRGVSSDVRLLGFQPGEILEGLYELASCVIIPSLYEGFGLPVLEAMSRGIPVACSDIPALREVAAEAALWFDPTDPRDIAANVHRLIHDRALAEQLSTGGRERATRFSWARAADATLACYRAALRSAEGD